MPIYLLVHGSWHGAWCWDKVAPLLRAQGHLVYTPDLPGHGADKTSIQSITLQDYVACISQMVAAAPAPVILVGHSMAGIVISQVAENLPSKIQKLVYLAAFLPIDGESMFMVASKQKPSRYVKQTKIFPEQNLFYFPLENMQAFAYQQTPVEEFAQIAAKFCQEPLRPLQEPVTLTSSGYGSIPRVYIECLADRAILPATQKKLYERTPCEVFSLACDHSPFLSDPVGLAELLHKLST